MLKDSIDFDYAIQQIITDSKPEILHQEKVLDSDKMNDTFKNIETNLNTLYEKTRFLEDSIQYAKEFLATKTREFNDEMDAIIKELENTVDMTKNLAYLSYNVPLKANAGSINDRDPNISKLPPLILKDKNLAFGYESDVELDFSSIVTWSDSIPYDDTSKLVVKDKSYKAIFLEEKIIQGGLVERMTIYFPQPVTINVLDFVTSNCNVKNIKFGLINGIEEYASDYKIGMNNVARTCTYVIFDMVCTNYNTIVYEIDKDKMTDNLWNDLKEFEKAKTTQLDKINKLNAEYIISRTTTNIMTGKTQNEIYSSSKNKSIMQVSMYSYVFGLDKISFKFVKNQKTGYFISDYITVGKMKDIEYLQLYVSQVKDENCAIEYSILDGEKEIPIIPVNFDIVENEPIFNTQDTRFLKDYDTTSSTYMEDIIKKDGQLAGISYNDAKNMNDGQYTITYKPGVNNHSYTPINSDVRIKCYMRSFGTNIKEVSYIEAITIRKYGEDTLWINKY